MEDEEKKDAAQGSSQMGRVVVDVTAKALQEFALTIPRGEEGTSRPASAKPDDQPDDQPLEQPLDQPPVSTQAGQVDEHAAAPSAVARRESDAAKRDSGRPISGRRKSTSKPSSKELVSRRVSEPESGRPPSGKPDTARPESARRESGKPETGRPESVRAESGRPGSGRRIDSRRVDSRGSARGRVAAERSQSGRVVEPGRPTSTIRSSEERSASSLGQSDAEQDIGRPSARVPRAHTQIQRYERGSGDEEEDMSGEETTYDEEGLTEEEEEEEEEGEEEGEEEEEGSEMVVLDPDHPLMQRFQKALNDHLEKQTEKMELQQRELEAASKSKLAEREGLGVELYGVQQELARFQTLLETCHDKHTQLKAESEQTRIQVEDTQNTYREKQTTVNKEREKCADLQQEVENISLRLFYMGNAKEDARGDIAVIKRTAEKADTEVTKAEILKQKQDLFVDRLVENVDKLNQEIAMLDAQLLAQTEQTSITKEALNDANVEVEGINLERAQLFRQWNTSVIGMKRRDEALSALQDVIREQEQLIISHDTELDGIRKTTQRVQEENERLTITANKCDSDINTLKRQLSQNGNRLESIKNEYATYTRMLKETELALSRATADKTLRSLEETAIVKQLERQFSVKLKLEDEILEKLRSQLTTDKAAIYTEAITKKLRRQTKTMEMTMLTLENEAAKEALEKANTQLRCDRQREMLTTIDSEIKDKNDIVTRCEVEITKRNAIIERKQSVIDKCNKRLEVLLTKTGGEEVGPMELTVNSLHKSVAAEQEQIADRQQIWLREQNVLVQLTQDCNKQLSDVLNTKKSLSILTTKKFRIENDISIESSAMMESERNIRNMQNDMLQMNTMLNKEKKLRGDMEHNHVILENNFVTSLKEAEMEAVKMQTKLDAIKEEKERLLNSLVEAERQIMLWEKKTQLAEETRSTVDSDVGQGEIHAMKAEIHRMEVRHKQLMKQQEKMIQEMEKAVSRRDTIVTQGDAQVAMNKQVLTKGTFQRQMVELRKKIKQTIKEANSADNEIRELRDHQNELSQQLEEGQLSIQEKQSGVDTLDGDIERLLEQKQKNMNELLNRQQTSKYHQQVRDKRYTRVCRTTSALETEREKQQERTHTIAAIIDRLNGEFSHVQPALRKVTRLMPTQ